MGFGADITIYEQENKLEFYYDNYKGQNIVFFDLLRNQATKSFPLLDIHFWAEKQPGKTLIANVQCALFGFTEKWLINVSRHPNTLERLCRFDMNRYRIFNHFGHLYLENMITLKIYMQIIDNPL